MQVGVADGAVAHRLRRTTSSPARGGDELVDRVAASRRARTPRARARSRSTGSSMPSRGDVLPDVELGPVRQREDPDALARVDPAVVEVPQLGALVLRVPLAELVAEGEDPLLGPGLLLVAAGAAEQRVEAGASRRRRAAPGSGSGCASRCGSSRTDAAVDRLLDAGDDQLHAELGRPAGRGTRAPRGSCGRCRRASPGTGSRPAQNAFSASRSMTIESLPPENSSTGRSNSATTSRMMWIASASSASQLAQLVVARPGRSPASVARRLASSLRSSTCAIAASTRSASSGRQTSRSGSSRSGWL